MSNSTVWSLNKVQKYVIFAVSLGNILEWYDVYLYIFWAPILSEHFFGSTDEHTRLFFIVAFFAAGFILRPLGGAFFGRLGDKIGRRKAFICSMVCMALPTFFMGFLPTYSQIGIWAGVGLAVLRILQTFPSGGELPGAFCYLYENASGRNKIFMSSFGPVGNQIGIALAALECYLLKTYFPEASLVNWGWRISFIVGGFIGLAGFILRYRLHETKLFQEVVIHHKMSRASIWSVFKENWKGILRGISFGAAETISFHFVAILFPVFFYKLSGMTNDQSLIATLVLMLFTALPMPIYGLLAEKYGVKRLALGSCILMICLLYPLYHYINLSSSNTTLLILGIFSLLFTCLTALWPYVLACLFPTNVRYTCMGLSLNMSDGILGGLSSMFIPIFFNTHKDLTIFVWFCLIGCLCSMASLIKFKPNKSNNLT